MPDIRGTMIWLEDGFHIDGQRRSGH
jgi:hypothetical protein